MTRLVSRAENWEQVYTAFSNINFAAFDYNSIKQSLLEYIKLYFPESFNDYIETSEFIAIIESFAYIAELIAYRLDMNANENFISTAQRRDSILRLAKLVSYKADRPLPARGLVKLQSVATTETVYDSSGLNLANRTIRWNDVTNTNWKDQFILIMNRVLERTFGSALPSERFQVEDVVFEQYGLNLVPLSTGVFTYNAITNGVSTPMELVPVTYSSNLGIIERRPANNSNFTLLYGSDGLGDASNTTGFFCYTKQGTLQKYVATFDGVTPNQTYDISQQNVNDTDVWINNVDPTTGATLDLQNVLPYKPTGFKSGEWQEVDLAHAQNVIFNTNPARNKYELETLAQSRVRVIFGDGEFADIPKGTFNIWARTSLDQDIVVSQSSVVNTSSTFTYLDSFGRTQTFTFTYSLINSLQNGSAAETLDHIRITAPAVYYTQDRMVNGQDYNVYPLQDSSILKLRSINRTFAGDSKYITWHDPSGTYENVKMFASDGIIYFYDTPVVTSTPTVSLEALRTTYLQPLISTVGIFNQLIAQGVAANTLRTVFNAAEIASIDAATGLNPPAAGPVDIVMWYDTSLGQWVASTASLGNTSIYTTLITAVQPNNLIQQYQVTALNRQTIFESDSTQFWNVNDGLQVVDYDTLRTNYDSIVVLQANPDNSRTKLLSQNWNFDVLSQQLGEQALPIINNLVVVSSDANGDSFPDNAGLTDIIDPTYAYTVTPSQPVTLPNYIIAADIVGVSGAGSVSLYAPNVYGVSNQLTVVAPVSFTIKDHVYFSLSVAPSPSVQAEWTKLPSTQATVDSWTINSNKYGPDQIPPVAPAVNQIRRNEGRDGLNFAWFHYASQYHLVDPAPTNIIDMYIITKGYYSDLRRWLTDSTVPQPTLPTPLQLRTDYAYILTNAMVSDSTIPHPGKIKLLFGPRALPQLRATIKIVRSDVKTLTDNQVKTTAVTTIRNFFDITQWNFGETFYWAQLQTAIQTSLASDINSVVLVPTYAQSQFGDLEEIVCAEDEVFYVDISVDDIEIVTSYTTTNLRMNG